LSAGDGKREGFYGSGASGNGTPMLSQDFTIALRTSRHEIFLALRRHSVMCEKDGFSRFRNLRLGLKRRSLLEPANGAAARPGGVKIQLAF
jgi:hypothetical protein